MKDIRLSNLSGEIDIINDNRESDDYDLLLGKLSEKMLKRDDLLCCASKVYETIKKLNKK